QVQYEFGEVRKIDTENNKIYFQGRSTVVAYDYLVIALGCEDNYHDVEGAKEYTNSLQSFSKARNAGMAVVNLKAYGKISVVLGEAQIENEIRFNDSEIRREVNIWLLDSGDTVLRALHTNIKSCVVYWFLKNDLYILPHPDVEYVE